MKTFSYYKHPVLPAKYVQQGYNPSAALYASIWFLKQRMYRLAVAIGLFEVWALFALKGWWWNAPIIEACDNNVLSPSTCWGAIDGSSLGKGIMDVAIAAQMEGILALILLVLVTVTIGLTASKLQTRNLLSRGYVRVFDVEADNVDAAMAQGV